jgi:sugar O-acyltransferase (sialic acid O-acetyltransferase NeuD family)
MKKDLFLIGGGGHCVSVIDAIEQTEQFKIQGILDKSEKIGSKICGYAITGSDKDLEKLKGRDRYFLITIGQIQSAETRKRIFMEGTELGLKWATIVSPLAYISKHAEIGEGTSVLHGVLVNAGAKIGKNCIINTKSLIEHEAIIGDHCHIATGAIVNGQCEIGDESFIGSSSVLKQNLILPAKSFVQAGSFEKGKK